MKSELETELQRKWRFMAYMQLIFCILWLAVLLTGIYFMWWDVIAVAGLIFVFWAFVPLRYLRRYTKQFAAHTK